MNNIWSKECDSLVIGGKKVLQWHCKTMQEMKFENYFWNFWKMFKCDSSWSMNEFVGKHYDKVPQWNWIILQLMKFKKYSKCSNVNLHDQWMKLLKSTMIMFQWSSLCFFSISIKMAGHSHPLFCVWGDWWPDRWWGRWWCSVGAGTEWSAGGGVDPWGC